MNPWGPMATDRTHGLTTSRRSSPTLGFRKARAADVRDLRASWLVERALEHDRPTLLLQLACEKLRTDKVVRPGPTSSQDVSWRWLHNRRPSGKPSGSWGRC